MLFVSNHQKVILFIPAMQLLVENYLWKTTFHYLLEINMCYAHQMSQNTF